MTSVSTNTSLIVKGKKAKSIDPTAYELVATMATTEKHEFDAQEIIDRMMLAFCNETVRCLEDNIVSTASEADMAMIMGCRFPSIPWWSSALHRPNRCC